MNSKRYDVCQARERGGKTYWNKIGSMWEGADGNKSITFDALPVAGKNRNGEIETRAMIFEPKPRDGSGAPPPSPLPPRAADDDIPF